MPREIISGIVRKHAEFGVGVVWILTHPIITERRLAVVNTTTTGYGKVINWKQGTSFSVDASYKVGPDAVLITEIH